LTEPFVVPILAAFYFWAGMAGLSPAKKKPWQQMPRLGAIFKGRANYSALAMPVNVAVRFVPTDVTAVMITTAMSAAMSPYSMAVTPDSFRAKR
jgi:hypothetical protein